MAQDIITLTLCDQCLTESDTREDAKPYQIGIGGSLADIDLCELHAKPLAGLAEFARPVKTTARRGTGAFPCPLCDRTLKDQPGLARHMTRVHPDDTTTGIRPGTAVPAAADGTFVCPECDRAFTRAQGLAVHRFRTHGVRGPGSGTAPTEPA